METNDELMVKKNIVDKESDLQIKFPIFEDEKELDDIGRSLDCNIFVPKDTLQKFIFRLREIDTTLSTINDNSLYHAIEKKKKLLKSLAAKCEKLKQREQVISMAEEAELIANSSPFLSDKEIKEKTSLLKNRIDNFIENARPSNNNMKFLRFAKRLLSKAEKHEPVILKNEKKDSTIALREASPGEITLDDFALAETLYELANNLYEEKIDHYKEMLQNTLSSANQKELSFHVSNCGGKLSTLDTKEDQLKVIQGILGFAHTITDYYASETPYPSTEELTTLFSDQMY
ncbi:MAG: hypothetical protein S4CHLAM20_04740 [Chlamydiia bacterium]|nr:hypothetical protein [Chlamydiia bacterium]